MGNKIQLFGELESVAVDKKLVDAVQVKDSAWIDPEEMILALAEKRDPVAAEETQSKINERLREEALYAQSQFNNLSIHYNKEDKRLQLLLEGESLNGEGIDASAFTKDGMIETVLGPVTPVWEDVTDNVAAGTKTEKAKWAVAEDTGEQAFFALDVPPGYLLIQEITLGNTYLGFIWNTNTDADKSEGKVYDSGNFKASALDVSTLFNPMSLGPGLEQASDNDPNSIKIKIQEDEKYLRVNANGLSTIGIDTAIEAAVKEVSENVDALEGTVGTLSTQVNTNESLLKALESQLQEMNPNFSGVQEEVSRLKKSVAFREIAFETTSGTITPSNEDAIIRNIHCYYGGEEIEVLITRGNKKGNYKGDSVTFSCNDNGLALGQDNAIMVTYEEVLYDQNNVSSSTTTNNE